MENNEANNKKIDFSIDFEKDVVSALQELQEAFYIRYQI